MYNHRRRESFASLCVLELNLSINPTLWFYTFLFHSNDVESENHSTQTFRPSDRVKEATQH